MATLAVPASSAPPHVASLRSSSHVRQDGRRAATFAVLFPAATCISNCSLLASSLQETRGISSSSSATQRYLHYYSISTTTMTRFLGLCLSSQSDLNLAYIIHPSPCFCCCLDRCKEEKGSSSCRATRSSYKTKEIQQSRLIFKASH